MKTRVISLVLILLVTLIVALYGQSRTDQWARVDVDCQAAVLRSPSIVMVNNPITVLAVDYKLSLPDDGQVPTIDNREVKGFGLEPVAGGSGVTELDFRHPRGAVMTSSLTIPVTAGASISAGKASDGLYLQIEGSKGKVSLQMRSPVVLNHDHAKGTLVTIRGLAPPKSEANWLEKPHIFASRFKNLDFLDMEIEPLTSPRLKAASKKLEKAKVMIDGAAKPLAIPVTLTAAQTITFRLDPNGIDEKDIKDVDILKLFADDQVRWTVSVIAFKDALPLLRVRGEGHFDSIEADHRGQVLPNLLRRWLDLNVARGVLGIIVVFVLWVIGTLVTKLMDDILKAKLSDKAPAYPANSAIAIPEPPTLPGQGAKEEDSDSPKEDC